MSTAYPDPGSPAWPPPAPPSAGHAPAPRPARSGLGTVAVTLALAALGAPLGLLWAAVTPRVPMQMTSYGVWPVTSQPEEYIAADGMFALLGLGFGVLAAIAVWHLRPRHRGPVGLAAVTVATFAAGVLGWRLGRWWGLAEYAAFVRGAPVGATIDKPVDLLAVDAGVAFGVLPWVGGVVLLPAVGAAAAYTLMAGWSAYPSLRPEPPPSADLDPADPAFAAGQAGTPGGAAGGPHDPAAVGGPPPDGDADDDSVWRRPPDPSGSSGPGPGSTGPALGSTVPPAAPGSTVSPAPPVGLGPPVPPVSSRSSVPPAPPAAPAPPAPDATGPSRG
ncbi:MAG TPA: DUF2567 domain-containing protein [Pilimelia sp.]|nr:DUF2567 domain-containing protein [Pilimelia sp.]